MSEVSYTTFFRLLYESIGTDQFPRMCRAAHALVNPTVHASGDFVKENPPDCREYVGQSKAPDGTEGRFSAEKGGVIFHGTGFAPTKSWEETHAAVEYSETHAFAKGGIAGCSGGPRPTVLAYDAAPGKTLDVNAAFVKMLDFATPENELFKSAREAGARYVTFTHPNENGGAFTAIISLYPHQDLKSKGGWRL
jgi:hypothetical protein